MTNLKPIFVSEEIKKILELSKGFSNFPSISMALEDLLNESEKYNKLKETLRLFNNTPISHPIDVGEPIQEEKMSILDETTKKVKELLKGDKNDN